MDKEEIIKSYDEIKEYHNKYLKDYGVKLSALYNKDGTFIKNALVLIKLYQGYPNTKIITKIELTQFVREFYPDSPDVQQAKQLGMQYGWYILSGKRGDSGIPKGSYQLITLEKPFPGYCKKRREGYKGDFETIKKQYGYRCATCGAKEGDEHYFRKGTIVKLQKGHMNPSKPLVEGNIIPQCQICNGPYKGKWIFDKTGRVIAVASSADGVKIVKEFLKNSSENIQSDIFNYLKKLMSKKR